jgi:outer membrane immunogenic protein
MKISLICILILAGLPALAFAGDDQTGPVSWTGAYAGASGGFANGTTRVTPTGLLAEYAGPFSLHLRGGLAGGQAGYDVQLNNNIVLGAAGDMSWSQIDAKKCAEQGNAACVLPNDSFAEGKINWLATIRAKAGYAVSPGILIYGTGGLAIARTHGEDTYVDGVHNAEADATQTGWTAGAGADYRLTDSLMLGLEYLYADLGHQHSDYTNPAIFDGTVIGSDSHVTLNIFRVSLSYRF